MAQYKATLNRYTLDGSTFNVDPNGRLVGVQWTDINGNVFTDICIAHDIFNYSGFVDTKFFSFIQPVGSTVMYNIGSYNKQISDTSGYMYDVPSQSNFGTEEPSPFNADGSLKSGLVTDAQFFINNIIFNIHGIQTSISEFIYNVIKTKNNLS